MLHSDFSVLLSVYWKERADYLHLALKSIWDDQTVKPSEIVLVKDGPLTPELDRVISGFQMKTPLKVIALEQNQGLGRALNEGLKHCSCEWVARMDSDDISMPNRFEMQLAYIAVHPETAVLGAWITEFEQDTSHILSVRRTPESQAEIVRYSKKRCPVNHPVVMFRRSAVQDAGNYQHLPLFEDYWLWTRMLAKKEEFHNIQQSLLWFRVSDDMFRRRGGFSYIRCEYRFQKKLRNLNFISRTDLFVNMSIRSLFRLIPNRSRAFLYKQVLRSKN